jgi:signal peptidase I
MKSGNIQSKKNPSSEQIERELKRRELSSEVNKALFRAVETLVIFAAVAALLAVLLFPTVQVQRGSMSPTLRDGEQIILITVGKIRRGDIIAFHLGNQTLLKRVVATASEAVTVETDGEVYINGELLDEPYLQIQSFGECDLDFPFFVPDKQYFVMGDNRAASMDSRLTEVGTIHRDDIIGKTILRIWPLNRIGLVN